ncbi:MAG: hypothetical protein M3209_08720 [Acidobacteriota bacterium]|nr:hypothetical protein [Acidobacteriota bacterium]
MKLILTMILLISALPMIAVAQVKESCAGFQMQIKETYNFKPSKLSGAERDAKSAAMDKVWNIVKTKSKELLPCLRAALANPKADQWFLFDGSNLLVELDPSPESKAVQIRNYMLVDLDDVNLQVWVETLAQRGTEGFDVSEAGNRWLTYPKAKYFLPRHGAYEVKTFQGALFIYGSMDEFKATPALLKIVNQANHPGREDALWILLSQATPESLRALKQIDASAFSEKAQKSLRTFLNGPEFVTPRAKPKTSREEFLRAFQDIVSGNWDKFSQLVSQVPDGEKDVVAVLKPEDAPLVRKVRRLIIANANPHAIEFYHSFTSILMTMMWKPDLLKGDSTASNIKQLHASERDLACPSSRICPSRSFNARLMMPSV